MKIKIETERFKLRLIEDSDLENVYKGLSDPQIIKYYGVSFTSLEHTKEQMEWFANLEKTGTGRWFAICDKNSNEFMGAIGYNDWSKEHKKAEIGMWLLSDFWGKGTLREVMPVILDYGFNELGLHRVEGFVDHHNSKCKKALDKINFQYEGTMRDCEFKDGVFHSIDVYACLAPQKE